MSGPRQQRVSVEARSQGIDTMDGVNTIGDMIIRALDGQRNRDGIELVAYASEAYFYEDTSKTARRIIDFACYLAG